MKAEEISFPCPSCGFEVFSEPPGSYEICDLCGWEDDHVQLRFPAMAGGANKLSLAEYQLQAIAAYTRRWCADIRGAWDLDVPAGFGVDRSSASLQ